MEHPPFPDSSPGKARDDGLLQEPKLSPRFDLGIMIKRRSRSGVAEQAARDALAAVMRPARALARRVTASGAAVLAVGLGLFLSFPSYDVYFGGEFKVTWNALDAQIASPLTPQEHQPESHEAKRALRLTIPVVAHLLGLNRLGVYLLNAAAGFGILVLVFKLARQPGSFGNTNSFVVCLGCAGLSAGTSGFVDLRGIFDATGLFCLLASIACRRSITVASFVFLALFTDERAFLALPFVFLAIRLKVGGQLRTSPVLLGAILWGVTRYYLQVTFDLKTPLGNIGIGLLRQHIHLLPVAVWQGLEGFWIPVLFLCVVLAANRDWISAGLFAAGTTLVIVGAGLVFDLSRGTSYLVPLLPIAVRSVQVSESRWFARRCLMLCSSLSLLAPTLGVGGTIVLWWLPLPLQILRIVTSSLR